MKIVSFRKKKKKGLTFEYAFLDENRRGIRVGQEFLDTLDIVGIVKRQVQH